MTHLLHQNPPPAGYGRGLKEANLAHRHYLGGSKNRRAILGVAAALFLLSTCVIGRAQQKGQYMPGQQGLNAGVLPDPGFTYASLTINYSASKINDANGNSLPLVGSYDIFAVENIFYYVPKFKFLGARLAPYMAEPVLANGSLSLGSLNNPDVAIEGGGFGLADGWFQPVNLGWSLKRADINVGYAFVAPTGRYTPGASDNIGAGYWGNHITTGSTVYLTKNKATTANLFTDWETHGSKNLGSGTTATPGKAFTIEWGIGQILPLKKNFSQLLQLGAIGYDQWQVGPDGGFVAPGVPANAIPYYAVHAAGFQANYIVPAKNIQLFFKFEDEYRALSRPDGRTIVFGGSWTLRIPKPAAPKS